MQESGRSDASEKAAGQAIWKEKIKAQEFGIRLSSRFVAEITGPCVLPARKVAYLGTQPLLISTGIGFIVGSPIGQPIVFTGVGILLAYCVLSTGCG